MKPVKKFATATTSPSAGAVTVPSRGERINILFLIDGLGGVGGGTENHLATVVSRLNKDLFRVFVCAFRFAGGAGVDGITGSGARVSAGGSIFDRITGAGAQLVHFPVGHLLKWNSWRQARRLRAFIKEHRIDIVQSFHIKSDTYGVWVARWAGVPVIISSRRDMGDLKTWRHRLVNRIADRWITHWIMVCDRVKDAAIATEPIPPSRATTIYNGVDMKRFSPMSEASLQSLRETLDLRPGDFVVGSVAHFRPEKAYPVFFEGIERVTDSINGLKVLLVGAPKRWEGQRFVDLCREKGFDRFVRFVGAVQDVHPYLQLMDVVCLIPNRNEGLSNSILEAMAMGRPVIATDVGGNGEAVVHEENGLIIPPDDPAAFADALLRVASDPRLRLDMGRRGRERAAEVFDLSLMIDKMEHLYERLHQSAGRQV